MSIILLVLGILMTGVGVVLVGFGIPINDLVPGQTLIIAGATAIVGGPLLIGLAAAVNQLSQIAEGLKTRPAMRPPRAAVAAVKSDEEDAPAPRRMEFPSEPRQRELRLGETRPELRPVEAAPAPPADDLGASAIERLRSSIGRPAALEPAAPPSNGGHAQPATPNSEPAEAAPEPQPAELAAKSGTASERPTELRLDFLLRPRTARPPQPESFDTMWPKRASRGGADQPKTEPKTTEPKTTEPKAAEPPPTASPAQTRRPPVEDRAISPRGAAPQSAGGEERSATILKSGVVDGMAYTLYADGSIEAQLPQGTVRFDSIAELRAHIENSS
jgi:hypothetical protein